MIWNEIERLRREGINPDDFERARRSIYGWNISAFNSVESVASALMMFTFKKYELFRYIDAVTELTPDDVMDCLQQLFDPSRCSLSVIRPLPEEKEE